jgi:hypothetical protein
MPFHSGAEAAPATQWKTVVPSDTVNMPAGCRGIYVGGAGTITMVGDDGVAGVFTAVPVGTFVPCGPRRINATGTAATLMMALY